MTYVILLKTSDLQLCWAFMKIINGFQTKNILFIYHKESDL